MKEPVFQPVLFMWKILHVHDSRIQNVRGTEGPGKAWKATEDGTGAEGFRVGG